MEQRDGNTESPAKEVAKADRKCRNWFFTYNNPHEDDMTPEQMEHVLRTLNVVAYVFQKEVGANGTPHYQGCVSVKNPIKMPRELSKRIHWERAKSWIKAIRYCMKEESRVEGPWGYNVEIRKPLKVIKELRPWQEQIKELLDEEPDDRKIHWYWEETGNVGKTAFAKWMCTKYSALYLTGKAADCKYAISKYIVSKELHAVVFDFTRTSEEFVSYEALEAVKNGIFFSGKYEGGMCMFNTPHVIVFANWPPHFEKLSQDRWDVQNVNEMEI